VVVEGHHRPGHLEVEERVRVEVADLFGFVLREEEASGITRGITSVAPPREGDDRHRITQLGATGPFEVRHHLQATPPRRISVTGRTEPVSRSPRVPA